MSASTSTAKQELNPNGFPVYAGYKAPPTYYGSPGQGWTKKEFDEMNAVNAYRSKLAQQEEIKNKGGVQIGRDEYGNPQYAMRVPGGTAREPKRTTTDATGRQTQWDSRGEGTPITNKTVREPKRTTTDATGRQTQWDSRGEGTPAPNPSQSFLPTAKAKKSNSATTKSGRDWDKNPPTSDGDVIRYEAEIGLPKEIGFEAIEKMPEGPAKQKALKDNADFHKQADAKSGRQGLTSMPNRAQPPRESDATAMAAQKRQSAQMGGSGRGGEGTPAPNPSQSFLPKTANAKKSNSATTKSGRDWDKNPPTSDGDVIRYEAEIGLPKEIGFEAIEKMPEGPAKEKAIKANQDFHKRVDAKGASGKGGGGGGSKPQVENSFSGIPKLSNQGAGSPSSGSASGGGGIGGDPLDAIQMNLQNSVQDMNAPSNYGSGSSAPQASNNGGWSNGGGMSGGQGGGAGGQGSGQMSGALIGFLKKKKNGEV